MLGRDTKRLAPNGTTAEALVARFRLFGDFRVGALFNLFVTEFSDVLLAHCDDVRVFGRIRHECGPGRDVSV